MRLLYYYNPAYGKDGQPLEVNFCSSHKFSIERVNLDSEEEWILRREIYKPFLIDFFGDKGLTVSAVIGGNGGGKTTLLKKIINEIDVAFESIAVYVFWDGVEYYLWKSEWKYELKIEGIKMIEHFNPELVENDEGETIATAHLESRPKVNKIWLSNIVDFRSPTFGPKIYNLSLNHNLKIKNYYSLLYTHVRQIVELSQKEISKDSIFKAKSLTLHADYILGRNIIINDTTPQYNSAMGNLVSKMRSEFEGFNSNSNDLLKLKFVLKAILWNVFIKLVNQSFFPIHENIIIKNHKRIMDSSEGIEQWFLKSIYPTKLKKTKIQEALKKVLAHFDEYKEIVKYISIDKDFASRTTPQAFFSHKNIFGFHITLAIGSRNDLISDLIDLLECSINTNSFSENIELDIPEYSSGEFNFLNLYAQLNSLKIDKELPTFIFIDEGEIGFHPSWQRKYINELLKFVPIVLGTNKIHFIVSTHSPILASDVPSGNIIYLKDHKVVEKETLTFGANIHTLYKDAFFLEGGLIGEFAKEKIENLILFLKKKKQEDYYDDEFNEETAQALIDMIGEPFIQTKIQDLYNVKYGINNELEKLEKRIALLKQKNI